MSAGNPHAEEPHHGPSSHQYQDRGRWIFPALGAVAVAIVVACFFLPKAYRSAKIARGEALAEKAQLAMEAQDWDTAGERLKAALELAPKEPRVIRLVARLCDQHQMEEALTYWSLVADAPGATRADRQGITASALAHQRLDIAQPYLEKLALEDEDDLETLRLSIAFLRQKGLPDAALFTARRALERHPNDEGPQLALGSLLVQSPVPEREAEGRLLLWALVGHAGPHRMDAIQILAQDQALSRAERDTLLSYITQIPAVLLEDKLAIYALRAQVDPPSRAALIREAVQAGLPPASQVDTTRVLFWLAGQQAYNEVLEILPWPRAKQNAVWTFWHLSALGSLQRWQELKPRLSDKSVEIGEVRRLGMMAAMEFSQGNITRGRENLASAITAANGRPEQLVPLARQAAAVGAADIAMDAYAATLSFTPFARTAANQIILLGQLADHPEPLIAACRRLLAFEPGNQTALNELAYAMFIVKRRDADLEARVESAAAGPKAPAGFALDAALLRLVQGRPADALDLIEGRSIDWSTAPIRWKIIYAAALGASRQNESARRIAKTIPQDKLRPAERAWIESWL